jgi:lanosterol synthase
MDEPIDASRLEDSVDLLLTMQNANGGFASYELVRGNRRLEWLNTSEVFGTFMSRRDSLPLVIC